MNPPLRSSSHGTRPGLPRAPASDCNSNYAFLGDSSYVCRAALVDDIEFEHVDLGNESQRPSVGSEFGSEDALAGYWFC